MIGKPPLFNNTVGRDEPDLTSLTGFSKGTGVVAEELDCDLLAENGGIPEEVLAVEAEDPEGKSVEELLLGKVKEIVGEALPSLVDRVSITLENRFDDNDAGDDADDNDVDDDSSDDDADDDVADDDNDDEDSEDVERDIDEDVVIQVDELEEA